MIAVCNAGVVDQDIDALQSINGPCNRVRIGDIQPTAGCRQPLPTQVVRGLVSLVLNSGGQYDVDPLDGELSSNLSAEPSVRAGDECDSLLILHNPRLGADGRETHPLGRSSTASPRAGFTPAMASVPGTSSSWVRYLRPGLIT